MIRVLLVDDHSSFSQPLAFMLGREPDFTVVGVAASLAEARQKLQGVDLAIVDLDLPDGSGLNLIRDLRAANPSGAIMLLTGSLDRINHARAVEAGAGGVLHKSAGLDEIIAAARRLGSGEILFSPREVIELFQLVGQRREQDRAAQQAIDSLTPREREVLQALADGLNDKAIAQQLHISTETARTHMVNILRKLGVESRLQALIFALRYGAIHIS